MLPKYIPRRLHSVALHLEALKHLYSNSVKIFPWTEALTLFGLFVVLCACLSNQPGNKSAPAVVQRIDYQDFA